MTWDAAYGMAMGLMVGIHLSPYLDPPKYDGRFRSPFGATENTTCYLGQPLYIPIRLFLGW